MASVRKVFRFAFKALGAFLLVLVVALIPFSLYISHDSACPQTPSLAAGTASMMAIVHRCYGDADVLALERIEKPSVGDGEVLVRVRASALNPLDYHYLHGTPYLVRFDAGFGAPKNPRAGVDFAGTVEAVGRNVTRFHPGDAVFGGRTGALAEYVTVREDRAIAPKPANASFAEAAAVPIAAVTALQAVRDKGHVQAGQKVLINGASGGVGTFAVQIAKAFGAEVTGVTSTRNLDLVRSIGADHVVDYTKEDFTRSDARYDVIVDTVGTHGLFEYARVMQPKGIYVMVGGPVGKWLTPLDTLVQVAVAQRFMSQTISMMLAELNPADLAVLADLLKTAKIKPVIDRTYTLGEVPDAMRYLEKGHARGKVVIDVDPDADKGT